MVNTFTEWRWPCYPRTIVCYLIMFDACMRWWRWTDFPSCPVFFLAAVVVRWRGTSSSMLAPLGWWYFLVRTDHPWLGVLDYRNAFRWGRRTHRQSLTMRSSNSGTLLPSAIDCPQMQIGFTFGFWQLGLWDQLHTWCSGIKTGMGLLPHLTGLGRRRFMHISLFICGLPLHHLLLQSFTFIPGDPGGFLNRRCWTSGPHRRISPRTDIEVTRQVCLDGCSVGSLNRSANQDSWRVRSKGGRYRGTDNTLRVHRTQWRGLLQAFIVFDTECTWISYACILTIVTTISSSHRSLRQRSPTCLLLFPLSLLTIVTGSSLWVLILNIKWHPLLHCLRFCVTLGFSSSQCFTTNLFQEVIQEDPVHHHFVLQAVAVSRVTDSHWGISTGIDTNTRRLWASMSRTASLTRFATNNSCSIQAIGFVKGIPTKSRVHRACWGHVLQALPVCITQITGITYAWFLTIIGLSISSLKTSTHRCPTHCPLLLLPLIRVPRSHCQVNIFNIKWDPLLHGIRSSATPRGHFFTANLFQELIQHDPVHHQLISNAALPLAISSLNTGSIGPHDVSCLPSTEAGCTPSSPAAIQPANLTVTPRTGDLWRQTSLAYANSNKEFLPCCLHTLPL